MADTTYFPQWQKELNRSRRCLVLRLLHLGSSIPDPLAFVQIPCGICNVPQVCFLLIYCSGVPEKGKSALEKGAPGNRIVVEVTIRTPILN